MRMIVSLSSRVRCGDGKSDEAGCKQCSRILHYLFFVPSLVDSGCFQFQPGHQAVTWQNIPNERWKPFRETRSASENNSIAHNAHTIILHRLQAVSVALLES